MIANRSTRIPPSFEELKQRGDLQIAKAHDAVADAKRIAEETAQTRADSQRLHDRFHQPLEQNPER